MVNNTLLSRLAAGSHGPLSFGPDRRAHARVSFDCPVRWGREGEERLGWARDASESGAGFTVPAYGAPAIGERIRLVYRLDNCWDWLIDRQAEVLWCEPADSGLFLVGVKLAPKRRQMD